MASNVAILGAGPAGAAVAIALRRAGVAEVTLIDRPRRSDFSIGESAAPSVRPLLAALGLSLGYRDHLPYHGNVSLWGHGEPMLDDFVFRGTGPGWHLDRRAFDRWLVDQAEEFGAARITAMRLCQVHRTDDGTWKMELAGADRTAKSVRAAFVIDATGRSAALATRLGARRARLDTLVAVVVLVRPRPDASIRHYSVIETAPDGWWYAAKIPGDRAVLAFMTDSDLAAARECRHRDGLRRRLEQTRLMRDQVELPDPEPFRETFPDSRPAGAWPRVYPAFSQAVLPAAGPGWLAVGDAALAMDPLTSSGIACALADAPAAARAVLSWLGGDSDATAAYAGRVAGASARYVRERAHYYGLETRWPGAEFWKRRAPTSGS